jgi:PncC family amidohydrolase
MRTPGSEVQQARAGDDDTALARDVAALLAGRSIAAAESCTAGRVASALASAEGAADFFRGGLVAYQVPVKQELLGVSSCKVLNLRTAEEMAAGAARLLGAEVAVATTGVAGGEPVDGVPPGTVFVGTLVEGATGSRRHWFAGEPDEVCAAAARQALRDLVDALRAHRRDRSSGASSEVAATYG